MNEPVRIKQPEAAPAGPADQVRGQANGSPADPDRYFRLGESLLRQVRAELIGADVAWRRQRAELVDRARDELAAIDREHEARIARLKGTIGRLKAMREA